jgi:hypothetical protein
VDWTFLIFRNSYYIAGGGIHWIRNLISPPAKDKLIIRSHNESFFLWPMAYIGLAFALISVLEGGRLAVVPSDTTVETVQLDKKDRIALVLPEGSKETPEVPKLHITHSKSLGTFYLICLFIFINIAFNKLRGVFWWFFYSLLILGGIILWQFGWLDNITKYVAGLDIRLSAGFYFFFSLLLLLNFLLRIHVLDYLTLEWAEFSPGQIRICENFGEGITVKDASGLHFERDKSDWTRWLIGFGMGDLIIKTEGARPEVIRLRNVTNIDHKVAMIDKLLRSREIIQTTPDDTQEKTNTG